VTPARYSIQDAQWCPVLVGSLPGDAVAVQVRGVDYVAVTATVALGVLAVADIIFLNIRERAPEQALGCRRG
jgi:putative ABC transport system permease protein